MNGESWNKITVDGSALTYNFRLLQTVAGEIPIIAMVKGQAYGHGMVFAAEAFARAGCRFFGVAELCEGIELRQGGVKGEIFITIGFAPEAASFFFEHDLTPVISTRQSAEALEREASGRKQKIGVHLKINTGMGRLGLMPEEVRSFAESLSAYPHLEIAGAMSHFPEADLPGSLSTIEALEKFQQARDWLKKEYGAICHIANSGALLNHPEAYCDMVRAGIALYGYHPAGAQGVVQDSLGGRLKPAMKFASRIGQVKELPGGTPISYGRTYITPKVMKVAVIPVGYEDGLARGLSGRGKVLVGGRRVPILGRICMNMCMLDVSEVPDAAVGDEAVLLGCQGGECITADELAEQLGTISYEVLCRFGHMNKHFSIAE